MIKGKYILSAFLLLTILTSSVYFVLNDEIRVDIGKTYSTFKVMEDGSWVVSGQEYTKLMDGTKNMRASSRTLNTTIEGNLTTVERTAYFKNNCTAVDTYVFDSSTNEVELFPISHTINTLGCQDYILIYEVTKLEYFGETDYNIGYSHEFGKQMKVEWEDGNYYERLYKYTNRDEGKLTIKYRPDENFTVSVRLFDPIISENTVFTKLISNKADLTSGKAIFEINNPVENLSVDDLFFSHYFAKGNQITSDKFYVQVTEQIEIPKYKDYIIEKTYTELDNHTGLNVTKTSQVNTKIEDGFELVDKTSWKQVNKIPKGKNLIKYQASWDAHIGKQSIDWFVNIHFDKDKYNLPKDAYGKVENKLLKSNKWAWWNSSWDYYKEYTNLTGNITYIYFNKSVNDNPGFTDSRFLSCTNDSLVFNHTLEATFDGQALAYNSSISPYNSGNLVSLYKLDNNDFTDAHGSNDGTNSGTTNTSGKILDARNFDGTNDNIQINDVATGNTWTISAWFSSTSGNADKYIFDSYSSGSNRNTIGHNSDGDFFGTAYNVKYTIDSWSNVNDGNWHHVVFSNNNGAITGYLDGIKKVETTGTASSIGTVTAIGSNRAGSSTNPFNGKIDEVAIFNSTYFESQIFELYNGTKGQFRVNNLGENCTKRYYGNSEATSTSSASDVYFEPVSAYYLDANANDFVGSNDGTNIGANIVPGYINGSYEFDLNQVDSIDIDPFPDISGGDFSYQTWFNMDTLKDHNYIIESRGTVGNEYTFAARIDSSGGLQVYTNVVPDTFIALPTISGLSTGSWYHLVVTHNLSSKTYKAYLNGEHRTNLTYASTLTSGMNEFQIGNTRDPTTGRVFDGKVDEVYIYEDELTPTQINQLYTQTAPNFIEGNETGQAPADQPPVVNLTSPTNNTNFNTTTITFNGTAYDDINLVNVTLKIDGILNETNSSGTNNSYYIFTKEIEECEHNWTYEVCDNSSQCTTADVRFFTVDLYNPNITILYPENISYDFKPTTLNFTLDETHQDTCWYAINGSVNITTNCSENITGLLANEGTNTWTVWANDTFGKEGSDSVTFLVDTINPNVTIIYPVNNTYYNTSITQLNYTINDTNQDSCWYSIDGGTTNSTSVSAGQNFTLSSSEGQNNWTVYCNDSSGNENQTSITFIKDTTYPLIEYTAGTEENNTNHPRDYIFVNVSASDTYEVNITFRLYNQTSEVNVTTYTTSIREINWSNLPNTIYTYNVTITDNVSHSNSTATRIITLDTIPPFVNVTYPLNTTYIWPIPTKLNYTASDTYLDSCWYSTDGGITNISITCGQNITGLLVVEDSNNNWTVYANDSAGNENLSIVFFHSESPYLDFNISITPNTLFWFYPDNNTHQGVNAYNQTDSIGVFTAHNNLTNNSNIVAKLNETDTNITLKIGNSSNYSTSIQINTTYQIIYYNLINGSTEYLWAWADYNNATHTWFPELTLKEIFI